MKKQPERMCIVCREMKDKSSLYRVVKTPEGKILLDLTGKMNGRGCYICSSSSCLEKLKKTRSLNRAFKMQVEDEIYEKIEKAIKSGEFKN